MKVFCPQSVKCMCIFQSYYVKFTFILVHLNSIKGMYVTILLDLIFIFILICYNHIKGMYVTSY